MGREEGRETEDGNDKRKEGREENSLIVKLSQVTVFHKFGNSVCTAYYMYMDHATSLQTSSEILRLSS